MNEDRHIVMNRSMLVKFEIMAFKQAVGRQPLTLINKFSGDVFWIEQMPKNETIRSLF